MKPFSLIEHFVCSKFGRKIVSGGGGGALPKINLSISLGVIGPLLPTVGGGLKEENTLFELLLPPYADYYYSSINFYFLNSLFEPIGPILALPLLFYLDLILF
jgi:hypothetical protein